MSFELTPEQETVRYLTMPSRAVPPFEYCMIEWIVAREPDGTVSPEESTLSILLLVGDGNHRRVPINVREGTLFDAWARAIARLGEGGWEVCESQSSPLGKIAKLIDGDAIDPVPDANSYENRLLFKRRFPAEV